MASMPEANAICHWNSGVQLDWECFRTIGYLP